MILVPIYLGLTSEDQATAQIYRFVVNVMGQDMDSTTVTLNILCRPTEVYTQELWTKEIQARTNFELGELNLFPPDFLAIQTFSKHMQWIIETFPNEEIVFVTWGELPFHILGRENMKFKVNSIDLKALISTLHPQCPDNFEDALLYVFNLATNLGEPRPDQLTKDPAERAMGMSVMLSLLMDGVEDKPKVLEPFISVISTVAEGVANVA